MNVQIKKTEFLRFFSIASIGAVLALIGAALGFGQVARAAALEVAQLEQARDRAALVRLVSMQAMAQCQLVAVGQTLQAVCVAPYTVGPNSTTQVVAVMTADRPYLTAGGAAPSPIVTLASPDTLTLTTLNYGDWLAAFPDTLYVIGTVINLSPQARSGNVTMRAAVALMP